MEILTIPRDIFIQDGGSLPPEKIAIRLYSTDAPSGRSRITLTKNLFSFLLDGEKTVHYSGRTLRIDPTQFLLLGQVGYENHSSFTHSFKQVFGITPSEFQQEKKSFPAGENVGVINLDIYQ